MRKIWDKIVAWILSIPTDKKLHFVAGVIIAAFFALALGMKAALVPVVFAAFAKEFFDEWTTGVWEWWDFAATCFGGVLIQVFILLGMLWL